MNRSIQRAVFAMSRSLGRLGARANRHRRAELDANDAVPRHGRSNVSSARMNRSIQATPQPITRLEVLA